MYAQNMLTTKEKVVSEARRIKNATAVVNLLLTVSFETQYFYLAIGLVSVMKVLQII